MRATYAMTAQSCEFGTYRTGEQPMLWQHNHVNLVLITHASSLCYDSTIMWIWYLSHMRAAYAMTAQSCEFGTYHTWEQPMLWQHNHVNLVLITHGSSLCYDSTIMWIRYLSHMGAAYAMTAQSCEFGTYHTWEQPMLWQHNHVNSVLIAQASSLGLASTIMRIWYLSHMRAAYAMTAQSCEFGTYHTWEQPMLWQHNHANLVLITHGSSLCYDSTIMWIWYLSHMGAAYAMTAQSCEFGTYHTCEQPMLWQHNHVNSLLITHASSLCYDSTIMWILYLSHMRAAYAMTAQSCEFGTYHTGEQPMLWQHNHVNSVLITHGSSLCYDSTIMWIRYLSHKWVA